MTIESSLYDALKVLVADNQVYPDVAPAGTPRPYLVYQQVGGSSINFVDSATLPGKGLPRFQVTAWCDTRIAAAALIKQVENAMRALTSLQPTIEAEPVSVYEEDTKLYGARQDYSFCG